MTRLIDVDGLEPHEQIESMGNGEYEYVEVIYKDDIDDAPTIDAVQVVRCKDCKNYDGGEVEHEYDRCRHHWSAVEPDDWCSFGERRQDDD